MNVAAEPVQPAVAFNLLSRHVAPHAAELSLAMADVVRSGYYVLGPNVQAFEAEFAAYLRVAHCIGVANGTDALEIALKAVGVGAGMQVAVTANAAMYSTTGVLAAAATPVFVDVEPGRATMDPERLHEAIIANPGLKAVVVTHLYGQLARIDELASIAREAGLCVVEDCAQAHGARTADGRAAGTIGDAGCFSFYPTKNLGALGDGGAVVSNDEAIAERVRQLRQYGWTGKYTNAVPGGRNSRLDEVQAAILRILLPHLDQWNDARRRIATRFSSEIASPRLQLPPVGGCDYVGHLYVVRTDDRDAFREHMRERGVQTEVHYPSPDHQQPCHQGRYHSIRLPITERDAETVVSLPCFPELMDEEISRVIDACNGF